MADIKPENPGTPSPGTPRRGPLGELADYIASHAPLARPGYPELDMLDGFREIWSRVDMGRQLRQSQEQVPDSAGPLNSSHLVHHALALMQSASPGYLQHFLSYMESLSWLERMHSGAGQDTTRSRNTGATTSTGGKQKATKKPATRAGSS
jgi:hypothetical protein